MGGTFYASEEKTYCSCCSSVDFPSHGMFVISLESGALYPLATPQVTHIHIQKGCVMQTYRKAATLPVILH